MPFIQLSDEISDTSKSEKPSSTMGQLMQDMDKTNKFVRYSLIAILVLLGVTIALCITSIVLSAVYGGGPSDQEMCDMIPGMCDPPGNGTDPFGHGGSGGNPDTTGSPSGGDPYGHSGSPSSTNAPTSPPSNHIPPYLINDSPGYSEVALQYLTSVNFSADPCEDFYAYACGQWPSQHPLPSSTGSWSEYSLVSERVSDMVEKAMKQANLSDASEGLIKAKHFYDTCMNVTAIEADQGTKLGALLHTGQNEDISLFSFENGTGRWALIDPDYTDFSTVSLEAQLARLKSQFGIDTFFLPYALQYSLNSAETILWLTPTMLPLGMGMFQQPYYLSDNKKYVRDAYQVLQKEVAELLAKDSGFSNVQITQEDLDGMLDLEIKLANLTASFSFDIEIAEHKRHNKNRKFKRETAFGSNDDLWTLEELIQKIPGFKWNDYIQNLVSKDLWNKLALQNESLIYVDFPEYYDSLIELLAASKPRDIRNYGIWRLVKYSLPYMSSNYTQALARFDAVVQNHTVTPPSQASVCLSYIRGNYEMPNLGFATAEAIVKQKYFPVAEKTRAVAMVTQVKDGLLDLIKASTWMDDETKANAINKATLMDSSIAYPDWVLNKTAQELYYKDLKIPKTSFISLNLMLRAWAVEKQLSQIGVPLDRSEFPGTPVATDAWYTESTNSLTAPLGELQPPFFGLDYPDAVNFGAAGAVFGHEMSHGFDKNGAEYDAYGNESNWWSPGSKQAFQDHCDCIIDQFDEYCYDKNETQCVNGELTLDENVADLAGLKAAYRAYKKVPGPQYRLAKAPMFSSDQLFFLSFASFWCGVESSGALEQQLETDEHTPLKFRVIGTVRNMPEFAEAFQCPTNSFMNPSKRCTIW